MEATGLSRSLIEHINSTFSLMEQISEQPGYERSSGYETNHIYTVEKLYSSYLNSIYSDLFILTSIDTRYGLFAQAVTKLLNQKQGEINNKLSEIIEQLCGGFE